MRKFKDIPEDKAPHENEHVAYNEVYRGTVSIDKLCVDDFVPSYILYKNQMRTFGKLCKADYSVSLFTNLEKLKEKVKNINSIKSYSKGYTNIKRGISTKESEENHVNYYLYDYLTNSPCDDFEIIEVKNEKS